MQPPFQVVAAAARSSLLLAATGSSLYVVNLLDGSIVSQWKPQGSAALSSDDSHHKSNENGKGPPSKKRKVDPAPELPNIIYLSVTPDERHAVVVTGEDKCLRVLDLSSDGGISQFSQRNMPRRPCAVTLSLDGATVFCADKFGDVYTVPLLPTPEQDQAARDAAKVIAKPFTPTASELTVHSKANLKSLQNQMKNAQEANVTLKKEPLSFAHDLILGHVSMLTDIIIAESHANGRKQFIVSADRDEHIRISRGPPQAYVIERFCLGHKDFISKLCLVGDDILISGGGDDEIYVWNWQLGEQLCTIDLRESFNRVLQTSNNDASVVSKVAVTGLWSLSSPSKIFVACEGLPALFHFDSSSLTTNSPSTVQSLDLPGNVLGLVMVGDSLIVSVDNIHQPGTTNVVDQSTESKNRLLAFKVNADGIEMSDHFTHKLVEINQVTTIEWHEKQLQTLLYSTENLRKRRYAEGEDAGPNEQLIDEEP